METSYNESIDYIDTRSVIDISTDKVRELFAKYEGDSYMTSRIHGVICNQFPQMLDTIDVNYRERTMRHTSMIAEQDIFIESFLANNRYFYCDKTDNFFYYDNNKYKLYDEDTILHLILSTITNDKSNLMDWKKRTRNNIMQRIKSNNILKTVPESVTIQRVIDMLCPHFFPTRNMAKYFLTIIGDNILKRNLTLVHFINNRAKKFIRDINNMTSYIFGANVYQSFKHKYHEHPYDLCRLINVNACVSVSELWTKLIAENGIDIICVASHYSEKHGGSDNFVTSFTSGDTSFLESAFYLKNHTQTEVIDIFMNTYIQTSPTLHECASGVGCSASEMSWKNIQYLWKHFLSSISLPSIMFVQTLKDHIILKLRDNYSEEQDVFKGVFSKFLPSIQLFLGFWDDTIIVDDAENDFEIDEISELFRKWSGGKILTDGAILGMISHYHPEIDVENDKYIQKIRCRLWDKQLDIQMSIDIIKDDLLFSRSIRINTCSVVEVISNEHLYSISVYNMYLRYLELCSENENLGVAQRMIVSKRYFTRYIYENMYEHIVNNEYIKLEWLDITNTVNVRRTPHLRSNSL